LGADGDDKGEAGAKPGGQGCEGVSDIHLPDFRRRGIMSTANLSYLY
jgi:hypothetical protein